MDDQLKYKEIVMNKHVIQSLIQMLMVQIMLQRDPLKEKQFRNQEEICICYVAQLHV
jgi:hypothetical protein